jgi:hypothetical protein
MTAKPLKKPAKKRNKPLWLLLLLPAMIAAELSDASHISGGRASTIDPTIPAAVSVNPTPVQKALSDWNPTSDPLPSSGISLLGAERKPASTNGFKSNPTAEVIPAYVRLKTDQGTIPGEGRINFNPNPENEPVLGGGLTVEDTNPAQVPEPSTTSVVVGAWMLLVRRPLRSK